LGIAQEMDNCIAYFKEIESDEIPKEKEGMLKNLGEKIFIEKLTIENITSLMKLGKDFETASEKIERMLGEKDNPVIKKIQERFGAGSSEALEDSGKRLMLSILFGSDSDLPSEKVLYSQSGSEKIDELAVSYIEEFVQKSSESSDMFSAKGFKNYMAKHKTNIDRKSGQDRGPISRGSVVDNDSSQVVIPSSSSSCSSTSAPSSSCSTSSSSTSTLVEQVEQIAEQRVT
jgi:hypothetical protein